jgi:cell division protein FtsI/penicillin-binding protein 2
MPAPQRRQTRKKQAGVSFWKFQSFQARLGIAAVLGVAMFGKLMSRAWQVQHDEHHARMAESARGETRTKVRVLKAERGSVVDTKEKTLACDERYYEVVFDNNVLEVNDTSKREKAPLLRNVKQMADVLSKVEKLKAKEIIATWSESEVRDRYVHWLLDIICPIIERKAPEVRESFFQRKYPNGTPVSFEDGETVLLREASLAQYTKLQQLRDAYGLVGLDFRPQTRRLNPQKLDVSHVLGRVRGENITSGFEYAKRKELAGTDGREVVEYASDDERVPGPKNELVKPVSGKSYRLTWDMDLQEIMEATFDEIGDDNGNVYVPNLKCQHAVLLLLDAKTLAIRSVVCRNTEPKDKKDDGMPPFNMAFNGVWEPGSILKPIVIAGALETGELTPATLVNTYGGVFSDPHHTDVATITDDDPFDTLTVSGILVHSSNIGAYQMARTIGIKQWNPLLTKFGIGRKTGIEISQEAAGSLPDLETQGYKSLASSARGYALKTSPLQMCATLGVFLNDGIYRRPYLVEETRNPDGTVESSHTPDAGEEVISPKTAAQVRQMMLDVVEKGTGSRAGSPHYWMAGKTGTSRYATKVEDPKPGEPAAVYRPGDYALSFLGYAPADDPKLIGLVVLVKPVAPANLLKGSMLAAPLFRRCMERALKYYEVPTQEVVHSTRR